MEKASILAKETILFPNSQENRGYENFSILCL